MVEVRLVKSPNLLDTLRTLYKESFKDCAKMEQHIPVKEGENLS